MSETKFFPNAEAFRKWLEANAASASEVFVGFHKVGSGRPSMTWPESVDEALCFGWIDGVRKRIDDESYQIRFRPRKPDSTWSAINIAKFHKLQQESRMNAAGASAFARRTDRKSAIYSYEQGERAELAPSEIALFKRRRAAWKFFEGCPPGYKRTVLHWVASAKKTETRAARLAALLQASAAGKRLR